MAYHDELLSQALSLVHSTPENQASLRRAVSSAYYAVFHLLIAEATLNWNNAVLRAALGRAFDHGPMKQASSRVANPQVSPYPGEDPQVVDGLRFVALTFAQLQEDRHFADYNLTKNISAIDALAQVKSAEKVFQVWPSLRVSHIAQEYLVSLVVKR
ncbi:MAG: hypothetical protein U0Q16_19430 [Bryobacteraceae bacterium]